MSDIAVYVIGSNMYAARYDDRLLMIAVVDTVVHSWWESAPKKLWVPDVVQLPEEVERCIIGRFECELDGSVQ